MAGTQASLAVAEPCQKLKHEPYTTLGEPPVARFRNAGWPGLLNGTASERTMLHLAGRGLGVDARLACIQAAALFHNLSVGDCAQVACFGQDLHLARLAVLYRQGDPVRDVSLLISGRAKITRIGPGGEEVILWLRKPGDVLPGLGLPAGTASAVTVQAMSPCDVLSWSAPAFAALLERFPVLHRNAVSITVQSLLELQERFCELATEQASARLARTLVRMATDVNSNPEDAGRIKISRSELAQMTGTTSFTVSRLLTEWRQRGLLDCGRETVQVRDLSQLLVLADQAAA